ncbi:MAG: hypothetical protein ACYC3Q_07985 [Gemmatimonadaceae bacterium]
MTTTADSPSPPPPQPASAECCDHCGSTALTWRKCKQLCEGCGNINRSCADL